MFFTPSSLFSALSDIEGRERAVLQALLPGPVTLLLGNPAHRFPLAGGPGKDGGDTLGVRVPLWSPPLAALGTVSVPVLQSSANLSGKPDARRLEVNRSRSAPGSTWCLTVASCRASHRRCSIYVSTSGAGNGGSCVMGL